MNELREKYAETQKGLKNVQDENWKLTSTIEENEKKRQEEVQALQDKLVPRLAKVLTQNSKMKMHNPTI